MTGLLGVVICLADYRAVASESARGAAIYRAIINEYPGLTLYLGADVPRATWKEMSARKAWMRNSGTMGAQSCSTNLRRLSCRLPNWSGSAARIMTAISFASRSVSSRM